MTTSSPMTKNGREKIEKELNQLIKVEREVIKKAIAEARALGDLKENAEYHSAKEKQGLIEGKIMELQGLVAQANVIDISSITSSTVVFGATVNLIDVEKDISVKYQIVGQEEANIRNGKISYNSPLGKALIGKEEGDTVVVRAPKGDVEYEIEEIEYI